LFDFYLYLKFFRCRYFDTTSFFIII